MKKLLFLVLCLGIASQVFAIEKVFIFCKECGCKVGYGYVNGECYIKDNGDIFNIFDICLYWKSKRFDLPISLNHNYNAFFLCKKCSRNPLLVKKYYNYYK